MSRRCSTPFPYVALSVVLFSQHARMESRCMNISEKHEIGNKLPVYPLLVLYEIGPQMCYRECQAYTFCLSINFNRKMLICELNSQRRNGSLILVADNDFIYRDIPDTVRTLLCSIFKLNKNVIQYMAPSQT
jgi:hypothetical protein